MATAADIQAQGEAMALDYWRTIPDGVTVADALDMPYGGQRNLMLRKALGIKFPGRTIVQVTQADWVQIVSPNQRKAEWHAEQLREGLPEWQVEVKRTSDGWYVSAMR